MTLPSLQTDDVEKVKKLIDEGMRVLADVAALKDGLKETVDAIAEELGIPKSVINKSIRIAYKQDFFNHETELGEVGELLEITKRK